MTDSQTFHVTVSYQDGPYTHVTKVYAIDEKTSRKLHAKRNWLGCKRQEPTGEKLVGWLQRHGCKLDSSTGPALTVRYDSGTTVETYFSDGLEHREGGPSSVIRRTDGSRHEAYYTRGEFCRAVECSPNGVITHFGLRGRLPPFPHF